MRRIRQFAFDRKTMLVRLTAIVLAVFGSIAMLSQSAFAQNTYMITDGDRITYHTSYATDPHEVLDEAGFALGKDDTYTTQESNGVSEIYVQRQTRQVTVDNGGQIISVDTQGETVRQLLDRLNVTVDPQTTVSCGLEDMTFDGMRIVVSRTTYATETYTQTIACQITELRDAALTAGQRKVLTAGSDGEMLCTAQVTYVNGVESSRTVVSSQVTKAPVDELVAVGTAQAESSGELTIGDGIITTQTGEVYTYTDTLEVMATAYSHMDAGCDMITATGTTVRWGTIAVDPSVIPYGTRMFVVSDNGSYVYGVGTAEDCGGGIRGNRIDLYMPTLEQCFAFGRRSCTVYILG